eukprot:m.302389 g.302389  ORF g.302389 m.302389 type:complete len:150 (-) comp19578_c0_seq3:431-880(-)
MPSMTRSAIAAAASSITSLPAVSGSSTARATPMPKPKGNTTKRNKRKLSDDVETGASPSSPATAAARNPLGRSKSTSSCAKCAHETSGNKRQRAQQGTKVGAKTGAKGSSTAAASASRGAVVEANEHYRTYHLATLRCIPLAAAAAAAA